MSFWMGFRLHVVGAAQPPGVCRTHWEVLGEEAFLWDLQF